MMEDFENALTQVFNDTLLPFEAKRYVVLKFARDVEDAYQNTKKQLEAEEKTKESEVKSDE